MLHYSSLLMSICLWLSHVYTYFIIHDKDFPIINRTMYVYEAYDSPITILITILIKPYEPILPSGNLMF